MSNDKTTQCKRCGSTSVGWVKSNRTGRFYLAFATPTHSIQIDGQSHGSSGYHVNKQTPHKCDDVLRGGYKACELCGKHHMQPMFDAAHESYCETYAA